MMEQTSLLSAQICMPSLLASFLPIRAGAGGPFYAKRGESETHTVEIVLLSLGLAQL